jgi:hypothetical protein
MSNENHDSNAENLGKPADLPPKKRGNHGKNAKFSHALFLRVIKRIEKGSFVRQAIKAEGLHHSTFYDHLSDKPDYNDLLKAAQMCGPINEAEQELYRRGVKGVLKPVFYKGVKCGTVREFDTAALIFYLKAAWPEKYARLEGDVVAVNVSQTVASPAQLAAEARNAELLAQFQARRKGVTGTEPPALPPSNASENSESN